MNKKTLFEKNSKKSSEFQINKEFEKKYNYNKKREEINKLKHKFQEEDFEDSSSESIDENQIFGQKQEIQDFLLTYAKVKNHDPEIYDKNKVFFSKDKKLIPKKKKEKKYTIKDQIIENLGKEHEESEEEQKETKIQIQERLKNEFLQAADFQDDEVLLQKKELTDKDKIKQEEEMKEFFKNNKQVKNVWDIENKNLDEEQKFLKDYIINQRWLEENVNYMQNNDVDKEDDELSEKVDKFEYDYNFRYENNKSTFSRNVNDTLRQEQNKRKEQREKLKQKQKEQKKQMQEQISKLKQDKKEKIIDKILKLKNVSGVKNKKYEETLKQVLLREYDDNYDQFMEQFFNDEYYQEQEDDDNEIKDYLDNIEQEFNIQNKSTNKKLEQEKEDGLIPTSNLPVELKHKINKDEAQQLQNSTNKTLWWYCDNCFQGIKPLEQRFDCMECANYCLCKKCNSMNVHNHKLKKFIVPDSCLPPQEQDINQILDNMLYCNDCQTLINKNNSYYQEKQNQEILCNDCIMYIDGNKKLRDYSQVNQKKQDIQNNEIRQLVDEYEQIDFEDVIAGGIKTKYSYIDVQPDDFGLTDAELIFADDRILDQMLSVKKLNPYRVNAIGEKERRKIRKMRVLVRESAEKNQKKFLKEYQILQRENELKELSKKSKKYKDEYENFMLNKEDQIRQIYEQDDDVMKKIKQKKEIQQSLSKAFETIDKKVDQKRLDTYNLQQLNQ